jgi:two-component system chemotaxis response regulator CheB
VSEPEPAERPAVDVIAIGASAGGLQPLRAIVAGLPADLGACVLVVLHVAATGTSVLPQILARSTRMQVVRADDGAVLAPGRIIVAPPDRHLLVEDGHVRLSRGPRENGHRPAIDPLLRSLAGAYGPRCAGVILSGTRDDGTLGLAEVKRCGGVAIVQDPSEAEYPGMPANAMAGTLVDGVLGAAQIAPALMAMSTGDGKVLDPPPLAANFATGGEPLRITCPDCGGVLTETDDAGVVHFRCHVGHAFSPRSLLAMHAEGVERALWTAARSLEDRAALMDRLADRARAADNARTASQFDANARNARAEAQAIRGAIAKLDDGVLTSDAPAGEEITE